jgi:DNA replication protein DnaC
MDLCSPVAILPRQKSTFTPVLKSATTSEYLNDPTLADAIMDRLIHRSHKIHLQGKESMRKRTGKNDTKD